MTAYATATPAAYKQQSIMTATPGRLVVMLYDGAIRFFFQAAAALREGVRDTALERLDRGEAIVDHLLQTLDMSAGEIAERLEGIYVFSKRLLLEARLESDAAKIDLVRGYFTELRESWAQIAGA
ncbi:MAG TPA: flagellar export chaperone FliS [Solirubrobacteraceae bacterium]|nr:flagellar export chaperone FliS [Solirubrobacteraceae bacterium]